MNIVLISTSDVSAGRSRALIRMLRSVAHAGVTRADMGVSMLLLLQRCPQQWRQSLCESFPRFVRATSIDGRVSLSAARNVLLAEALSSGLIGDSTIVAFPDDDCWYPDGALDHVAQTFALSPQLDLWFCRYSSCPVGIEHAPAPRTATAHDVIRQASSNTMFVRGRIVKSGAMFDENLGVGTPIDGGEDTEYALSAHVRGGLSLYLPAEVIGHRDKNSRLRAKYYRGGLVAIARHARREMRIGVELVRKFLVGVWLVLSGQLSPAAFARAVGAALRPRRAASF
jgi:hypothetical protein